MKRYITYLSALLLVVGVSSCSSSGESTPDTVEVTFTTDILHRSAVTDLVTSFSNGDRLTFFHSTSNAVSSGDVSVGAASYTDGVWRPTPAVTLEPKERRYIFAIYPYEASATDPTAFPVTVASQQDYMYSGTGVGVAYETPTATLRMRHAMAILSFDLKSYVGGTLQAITIEDKEFPIEGTLRATGALSVTKKGAYTKTMSVPISQQGFTTDHPGLFIIPYKTADTGLEVKLKISDKEYKVVLPPSTFTAAKKYVARVAHTEQGVVLESNQLDIIAFDEQTEPGAAAPYSMLSVKINGAAYTAPRVTGTNLYGFIYWGDQTQEAYSDGAAHGYAKADNYVVKMDLWNAEEVSFGSLSGVEEIDFSKF